MTHSASEATLSPAGIERIQTAMNRYIAEKKVPGMIAAVEHLSQPVYFECFGMMDIEAQKPMHPDAIFGIQSMTKPIISVAILILMEAGRLRLDDPLSKYIPEYANARVFVNVTDGQIQTESLERPITLYHLITNTAGFSRTHTEPLLHDQYEHLFSLSLPVAEEVRKLAGIPLAYQPGRGWIYTWSFDVLGHVIEIVTGQPLDAALKDLVFSPLGMVDTDFYVPPEKVGRLTASYTVNETPLKRIETDVNKWPLARLDKMFYGSSGLVSTASDYLRFARMLLNKGELEGVRLLKPETVEMMTTNQLTGSLYPLQFGDWKSKGEGYGLGVGIIVEPTVSEVAGAEGTYGWSGGGSTQFWVDPKTQIIGLILSQFEPMFYHPIHLEFRSLVYEALV